MKKKAPSAASKLKPKISKPQSLRVLLVEDSQDDVLLIIRELKKGGYNPVYEQVETATAMRKALREKLWDVILCDYKLPKFSGAKAIALLKETHIDIPLIIVSGTIGEGTAVECMRLGAHDYIMKNNLFRLCPAVTREVEETEIRSKQKKAESQREAALEALRESEEKYRFFFNAVPIGIGITDYEGKVFAANRTMEEITGLSVEDLKQVGTKALYLDPKERNTTLELLRKSGKLRDREVRLKRKNGETYWALLNIDTIEMEGQKKLLTTLRDITERKKAEELLLASEARLKSQYQGNPIPTFTWQKKDETFVLVDYNQTAKVASKGKVIKYLGKTADEMYQDRQEILQDIHRCFTEKKVIQKELQSQHFMPGRTIIATYTFVPPDLIMVHTEDITERKQAQEALRESEKRFRALIEHSHDAITLLSADGTVLYDSPSISHVLGYDPTERLGRSVFEYVPPEERQKMAHGFTSFAQQVGAVAPSHITFLHKDGTTRHIEGVRTNLLHEPAIRAVVVNYRDITERKQAEEALSKSERFLNSIFNSIQDGISILDKSMNIVRVNSVMEQWYAYNMPLIGKKCYEAYHSRNERCETCPTWQTLQTGKSAYEIVPKHGPGNTIVGWQDLYSFPIIDDATGAMQGVIEYVRDITERKQAEEALRESEENFRRSLNESPLGIRIVTAEGETIYANRAILEIYGYDSVEELKKTPLKERYTPESYADFKIRREKRDQDEFGPSEYEISILRKNGEIRHVQTFRKEVIWNGAKQFQVIYRDITEQKQTEEKLKKSEEKYRLTFASTSDVIFTVDTELKISSITPSVEKILGYKPEELLNQPFKKLNLMTPESMERAIANVMQILSGEEIPIATYKFIMKDGIQRIGEITGSPLIRENKITGVTCVARDVTERKRAENALRKNQEELIKKNDELEESRKNVQLTLEKLGAAYEELKTSQAKIIRQEKMASIGQLAAGVAHEINNPMAFIASNLGTLDKYIRRLKDFIQAQSEAIKSLKATDAIAKLEKKRKELKLDYTIDDIDLLVKESRDGSERIQKIVQELSRFSRVDDAEYKDTNINECMESSINIVWNELKQKATLHKVYGNLPPTKCYPLKLNQVFINLLINAAQAIEETGEIKIKTWEKDGAIWVAVSDTGCGIPRENQIKIFEPFFTTKEAGKGTGLGLSISHEIMQRHKGEISFESKEGKGTTFTIRIPIV